MAEELNLHSLSAGAAAEGSQARRPRHGLRQGPLLRPRDQGPEVALRARTRCRPASRAARCRSTCGCPKLRGNTSADAMPIGPFRTSTQPVNLRDLEARFEAGAEVTPDALVTAGLIKNTKIDIKILGSGELTKKLSVTRARVLEDRRRRRSRPPAARSRWLRGEPVEKKPKRSKAEAPGRERRARGRGRRGRRGGAPAGADEAPTE